MVGGLKMTGGLLENWRGVKPELSKRMVKIKKQPSVVIPAYSGNTSSLFMYAKPVPDGGQK
jgi:hypothetical protein